MATAHRAKHTLHVWMLCQYSGPRLCFSRPTWGISYSYNASTYNVMSFIIYQEVLVRTNCLLYHHYKLSICHMDSIRNKALNNSSVALRVFVGAGKCLQNIHLAMTVSACCTILAISRHVTLHSKVDGENRRNTESEVISSLYFWTASFSFW